MAFLPILSFVLLLAFGSVDSWAVCESGNFTVESNARNGCVSSYGGNWCYYGNCSGTGYIENSIPCNDCPFCTSSSLNPEGLYSFADCDGCNFRSEGGCSTLAGNGKLSRTCHVRCTDKCSADSIACVMGGSRWDSANCQCLGACDTTYHCQNSGGPEAGGFGSPYKALTYKCVCGICEQTATLAGTCQDWGLCDAGVSDCDVTNPDSSSHPPCSRSGSQYTSGNSCYYNCIDGRGAIKCRPASTQYVAGNIVVAECPQYAPKSCFSSSSASPSSSSSGGNGSSSSAGGGGDSSSSDGGGVSSGSGGGGEGGGGIDYTPILDAIRDTLHTANVQRQIYETWTATFADISNNTFQNWRIDDEINNNLTSFQNRALPIANSTKDLIDSSKSLLSEIKEFLANDSLRTYSHDTTYSPFLRDILSALTPSSSSEGGDVSSSSDGRIPAIDTSLLNRALYQIANSFTDSTLRLTCADFNNCLATSAAPVECYSQIPRASECYQGGTPFDGIWNVEVGVLKNLWNAFWGDDSLPPSSETLDTTVSTPALDSARAALERADSSIVGKDYIDSVRSFIDSIVAVANARKNDTTKISPDSLWLDSAQASQYVRNALIDAPTSQDCFICHADLGNLGGLSSQNLSIHIDFANFGGFDFCAIIRAVVKIMTFVICLSLTLGSWLAAFGYNPKNDA